MTLTLDTVKKSTLTSLVAINLHAIHGLAIEPNGNIDQVDFKLVIVEGRG